MESSSILSRPVAIAEREADHTVVWLQGEHDVASIAALSAVVTRAIELGGGPLVLDLGAVEFMDVMTARLILQLRGAMDAASRSLVLRDPSRSARRVIDLCGGASLLPPQAAATDIGERVNGAW